MRSGIEFAGEVAESYLKTMEFSKVIRIYTELTLS